MAPRPHYRFLHKILRPLPVAAGQVEGITKQGTTVFGIQCPDKGLVSHSPRAGRGSRVRHTLQNVWLPIAVQIARKKLVVAARLAPSKGVGRATGTVLAHAQSGLLPGA